MRYLLLAFALLFATGAQAADLAGTWRSDGPVPRVLVIKKDKAGYRGLAHVLDHDRDGTPFTAVSGKDGAVRISLNRFSDVFSGKFTADGKSFSGSWKNWEGTKPIAFIRIAPDWKFDPSPHRQHFVQVEKGITLEVLDWGGNGPALVLLPGLGNSAHVFDKLAPKLTAKHRVYGITRRGFGESNLPPPTPENYDSDRLGDDALGVLNALKIKKAVLAGHSMGGAELSSVATRHPERVAGLVYLDAGYGYALYVPGTAAAAEVDVNDLPGADTAAHRQIQRNSRAAA